MEDITDMFPVLLIDDEPLVLRVAQALFTRLGFRCDTASRAKDALDLLTSGSYDIVVADLHMPNIGRYELLEKILQINPDQNIIIVSGSGVLFQEDIQKHFGRNIPFLSKPFNVSDILETLRILDITCDAPCTRGNTSKEYPEDFLR